MNTDEIEQVQDIENTADPVSSSPEEPPSLSVYLYPRLASSGESEQPPTAASQDVTGTEVKHGRRCSLFAGAKGSCTNALNRFSDWKVANSLIGWKFSLRIGAISATIVFAVNTALLIRALTALEQSGSGRVLIFEGSREATERKTKWIHFYINVVSTLLLSASNYSMQFLSAPNRKDTNRAHARRAWMEIGVLSFRNIMRLHWTKRALWSLLVVTSLLIHLW